MAEQTEQPPLEPHERLQRLGRIRVLFPDKISEKKGILVPRAIDFILRAWRTSSYLQDATIHILMILTFVFVIGQMREDVYQSYELMRGLNGQFLTQEFPQNYTSIYKSWYNVRSEAEFWQYAEGLLFGGIFDESDATQRPGYLMTANRLLGAVRLRQVRSTSFECRGMNQFECFGKLSGTNEEKAPYGPGLKWTWSENKGEAKFISYVTSTEYPASGYNIELPYDRDKFIATLRDLKQYDWIDEKSRAVFININLFNENVNVWIVLQMVLEMPVSGNVENRSYWLRSVNLEPRVNLSTAGDVFASLICPIILIATLIYSTFVFIRDMVSMNRYTGSMRRHFYNLFNVVDFCNLCLFVVFFLYWIVYVLDKESSDIQDLSADPNSHLAGFQNMMRLAQDWANIVQIVAFNYFLTILKSFKFLTISRRLSLIWAVLAHAAGDLVTFVILVAILVTAFAFMGFMLYGGSMYSFRRLNVGLSTTVRQTLSFTSYDTMDTEFNIATPIYYILFVVFIMCIFINIFIGILNNSYSQIIMNQDNETDLSQRFLENLKKKILGVYNIVNRTIFRLRGIKQKVEVSGDIRDRAVKRVTELVLLDKLLEYRKTHARLKIGDYKQMLLEIENEAIAQVTSEQASLDNGSGRRRSTIWGSSPNEDDSAVTTGVC